MANDKSSQSGDDKKHTVEVAINGEQHFVSVGKISYEEVVKLAFPAGPFDILYTVSYANMHGKDGTLAPGQNTEVKKGMSFNVIKTNRS